MGNEIDPQLDPTAQAAKVAQDAFEAFQGTIEAFATEASQRTKVRLSAVLKRPIFVESNVNSALYDENHAALEDMVRFVAKISFEKGFSAGQAHPDAHLPEPEA